MDVIMQEANSKISGFVQALGGGSIPASIIICAALIVFALFSYKIYRVGIFLVGAVSCGYLGFVYVAPIVGKATENQEFWLYIVVALVCALIGVAIVAALQRFAIFVAGAAIGFMVGGFLNTFVVAATQVEFLKTGIGSFIVPVISAIVFGLLAGVMFRTIFILGTACVSMMAFTSFIFALISTEINPIIPMVVGAVLGVACSVFQFKTTSNEH